MFQYFFPRRTNTQRRRRGSRQPHDLIHHARLFAFIVLGILAQWFWSVGWGSVGSDANVALSLSPVSFGMRTLLSLTAGALTYVPIYSKVRHVNDEWLQDLLAFQNGFFWQAMLEIISRQFAPL